MKTFGAFVLVVLALTATVARSQTVLELLQADPNFSILVSAAAQFESVVNALSVQNSTIFAPNNAAFAGVTLPANQTLEALLLYHIAPGFLTSSLLSPGLLIPTLDFPASLNGAAQVLKVSLNQNVYSVNNAPIVAADIAASNGYIHNISAIIAVPPNIVGVASAAGLNTLIAAVTAADLVDAVNGPALTVFGPTDAAFTSGGIILGTPLYNWLFSSAGLTDLQNILKYHVVGQVAYSSSLTNNQQIPTLEGQTVTVTIQDSAVRINNANVVVADAIASNGVAHVIDQVLLPTSFSFTLDKLLSGLGSHSLLLEAFRITNLTSILTSSTPHTILAPTDEAFMAVPGIEDILNNTALLTQILLLHVIGGQQLSPSFNDGQLVPTLLTLPSLNGAAQVVDVTVESYGIFFQDAQVILADQIASNGVVHVLNAVLIPPSDIVTIAASTPIFSTLVSAVTLAGLVDALKGNALTVFAPTNDAFGLLPAATVNYLFSPSGLQDLTKVLVYHVAPSVYYGYQIPATPTTIQTLGGSVVVQYNTYYDSFTVNNAGVIAQDVLASNGVIQAIDAVLVPSDLDLNNEKILIGLNATTLLAALALANLTSVISSTTNTLFAPTNAAFEAFSDLNATLNDPTALTNLLLLHVVNGSISSTDSGDYSALLQGKTLIISGSTVYVQLQKNKAQANILSVTQTSNGYIILIDAVLVPGDQWNLTAVIIVSVILGLIVIGAIIGVVICCYRRRAGYTKI